jgi:hypothetical protein
LFIVVPRAVERFKGTCGLALSQLNVIYQRREGGSDAGAPAFAVLIDDQGVVRRIVPSASQIAAAGRTRGLAARAGDLRRTMRSLSRPRWK